MIEHKTYSVRRAFIDIGLFSLGVNVLMLVMPLYMLQVYDRVLSSASLDTLIFLSIIAGFALVVLGLLEAVRSMYGTRIANRLDMSYARPTMLAAMSASDSGGRSLRELAMVRNFLNSRLAFVVFDLPFAPLFIGILYFIHPLLFAITLAGVAVLILIAIVNQWASSRAGADAAGADARAQVQSNALVANAETLRALGMTENAIGVWQAYQLDQMSGSDRRAGVSSFMTGLSRTIRFGLQIAILGVGAYLVLNREMTAGMIFASSIISGKGLQPIDQVIGSWRQIIDSLGAWRNLRETVDLKAPEKKYTDYEAPQGAVGAENLVYFANRVPGAKPVIKGLSFAMPAGASLGILGKSGAGKSTLLRLLAGAVTPASGMVTIDGNDRKNWNPESLGRHVGYVEQRVNLLPGTVAQNIARFDPDAKDEDIIAAAKAAHVDTAIDAFPDGYQTVIGIGGRSLSGGEMQQVGLARAFYGDPQILLLDEPNASLDPEARNRLDRALDAARRARKTIIVITQRDEILKHLDLLLALKDGQRVDFGTRDDVLERQFGVRPKNVPPKRVAANQPKSTSENGAGKGGKSPFAEFGPGMKPVKLSLGDKK